MLSRAGWPVNSVMSKPIAPAGLGASTSKENTPTEMALAIIDNKANAHPETIAK